MTQKCLAFLVCVTLKYCKFPYTLRNGSRGRKELCATKDNSALN